MDNYIRLQINLYQVPFYFSLFVLQSVLEKFLLSLISEEVRIYFGNEVEDVSSWKERCR